MRKYKVLIVDDSAFMRKAITRMVESDEVFKVIATARDGIEALEMVSQYQFDAITLDVEMPKLNGLETLIQLRKKKIATPVIIVSSITTRGSRLAIQCLQEGAFEIVVKPESYVSMDIHKISGDLINKLKAAVDVTFPKPSAFSKSYEKLVFSPTQERPASETLPPIQKSHILGQRVITIGSSTGGPMALQTLLSDLPADFPAGVVVVQHMPPGNFIRSLAERLNGYTPLTIRLAEDGDIIEDGVVYMGDIGQHVVFEKWKNTYKICLTSSPKGLLHCPAADVLFESAGNVIGSRNTSCILTGMGSDGSRGVAAVYENKGYVIAQSEDSCVVYGMPRSAVEAGYVHKIIPLEKIAAALVRLLHDSQ